MNSLQPYVILPSIDKLSKNNENNIVLLDKSSENF